MDDRILWGIRLGDTARIRQAIDDGADPNWRDCVGRTPLHVAAQCCCEAEIIHTLVQGGADPQATDWDRETPLQKALSYGKKYEHEDVIRALREARMEFWDRHFEKVCSPENIRAVESRFPDDCDGVGFG